MRRGSFSIGRQRVGDGIVIEPAWEDELMVAMPARHELLATRAVPAG